MYEYHNHKLSIPARLLYEVWGLMTYKAYNQRCCRKKLVRTKEGKGEGNEAFVSFYDLPGDIQEICINKLGHPKQVVVRNKLLDYMVPDTEATDFFARHRKPDGLPLSDEKQREKVTNCIILNAIQTIFKTKQAQLALFGGQKTKLWQKVSEAVNGIPKHDPHQPLKEGWLFSLPGTQRRLKNKYEEYQQEGYQAFIHKGEGTENSIKIKGAVADFILAYYQLPNKPSVPELLHAYELEREHRDDFPSLTEQGVHRWLHETKQMRVWITARDGKEAWRRKFANSIERDRGQWFPNAWWAIDGSKLDLIYYDPEASNKMGAKMKTDVLFDIYSEKIIGYSLSETENHADHIKAINRALQHAQARPYLFTYDNQSGHKMARMQDLYANVVAKSGGTHYPHKANQKSNPVEQIFKRLQQQVINKHWHSDKQSVKVRTSANQMNDEFIKAYKDDLPTKSEVVKIWEYCVKVWNEAKHPHFDQSRNQVYTHEMKVKEEITLLDIVSLVWVAETKNTITYRRDGLSMRLGDDTYKYEVYTAKGDIDLEFRQTYLNTKFIVRYNPEYLNDYVQLYQTDKDKNMVFVAVAQPKRKHESIPVLMKEGDKEQWYKDFITQEQEYERDRKESEAIAKRTGITREAMILEQDLAVKMGGQITKKQRNAVENIFNDL